MCGTGIIIRGRIVHESIFGKKALSGTEMIPKQYNTPLRHRKLVGLPMENWPLLGLYLTSGTITNPDLPSGNNPTHLKTPYFKGFYSSRFAIDSNMTAKNQDALLFTAEHLLDLGTDLIIQSAEK